MRAFGVVGLAAHPELSRPILPGDLQSRLPVSALIPDTPASICRVPAARDPVLVVEFEDGGLISYLREDGTLMHTLGTSEGFRRKLRQLGVELEAQRKGCTKPANV